MTRLARFDLFAPAIVWRAFFIVALGSVLRAATPPANAPAPLSQLGKPDAAEAARIIRQFQKTGIVGDYYLEFELHHYPRRGDETVFHGKLWGSRNEQGQVERISITDGTGREHRLLVQRGAAGAVWRLNGTRAEPLVASAIFEPLIPGVELTAFDLQMPFLDWPGARVESVQRAWRGRPANEFIFPPPQELVAKYSQLGGVRSYFDAQYNVPLQTELLGPSGAVLKTLALVDLKKVSEQWMMKSLEVRDETTRNKTRLVTTGAALNLALPGGVFTPAALESAVSTPERVLPLGP